MTKDEALTLALNALQINRRPHYYCENRWHSCPRHEEGCANDDVGDECNCGADKANAELDTAIAAIKALAQPEQEPVAWEQFHEYLVDRNFCPRCGKRLGLGGIHTCTPPQIASDKEGFYGLPQESVSTSNAGGKCVTAGETAPIHTLNSTKTVAVATDVYWLPIDKDTPRSAKLQLLSIGGVAQYGALQADNSFYTHWCPLPKKRAEPVKEIDPNQWAFDRGLESS